MKIAVFHNLPSGGAKRALFEWTRRLAVSHVIDVYTLSTADHGFCDLRLFTQNYYIDNFFSRKLFKTPWGRLNQLQRLRDLNDLDHLYQKIAKRINSGNYDLLFAHPDIFTLIPRLLVYIKIPILYYLHEPFGHGFVRHFSETEDSGINWRGMLDRFDPLIWIYHAQLERIRRQSVQKANLLLSNSEFTQEITQNAYEVIAPICHYGVNLEGFRPLKDILRENFVLSVGELSPRKGFDFIIKSLGYIVMQKRPILKLACNKVDEQERMKLQDLAAQNGVNLEILIDLSTDELRILYNKARFCVYSPVLEPFGLVPLEAMACGTAVVGIKEGGVKESVVHEQTGLLIERDIKKFSEAILRLLDNPTLAEQYGENGRDYVLKNWTWERSTEQLEEHFAHLVH